jgi:RNA polymerase sigma-70 factor, ECF subfamily
VSSAPPVPTTHDARSAPVPDDGLDERALVGRAATDVDAFATLYRRYVGRVYAYIARRTGSRELAEDVTSATFERALRSLPQFEWRAGGVAPWLFRIASNELTDHYRSQARQKSERAQRAAGVLNAPFDEAADAHLNGIDATDVAELRRALDQLNPRYQRALELRYLAGLRHEDAARAFGAPKATFAVVLHRATSALRKQIEAEKRGA